MSPSRTSPSTGQTEMSTKDRGDRQSPGVIAIRTPPVPPVSALDPDHRNHRQGTMQHVKCPFYSLQSGQNEPNCQPEGFS